MTETKTPAKKLKSVIKFEEVGDDIPIDLVDEAAEKAKKAESPFTAAINRVAAKPPGRGERVPVPEGFEPKQVVASLNAAIRRAKKTEEVEAKRSTHESYVWLLRKEPPKPSK
jgi:hypothetical protein